MEFLNAVMPAKNHVKVKFVGFNQSHVLIHIMIEYGQICRSIHNISINCVILDKSTKINLYLPHIEFIAKYKDLCKLN